jgi:anti-anti-sigma factor
MQIGADGEHKRASVELLQWSTARSPDQVSVVLEGEVDLSTADVLGNLLAEVLEERPSKVVVDLAGVSFLDSAGVKCLLAARTAAATGGCRLVVRRPTRAILRIFTICDVAETLLGGLAGDASVAR